MTLSPDHGLLPSPRRVYYNPKLDPRPLEKMTPAMADAAIQGTYDDGSVEQSGPLHEGLDPDLYRPNLISSLCEDGLHRPAIDFDYDIAQHLVDALFCAYFDVPRSELVVVRSTSNWHVYVPTRSYQDDAYFLLLDGLAAMEVIDDGYLLASEARGQTLLRPPDLTKTGWKVTP